jgi:arylsulfatase A-like enzyme
VRVPFLARWPERIPSGTVRCEAAMTIDLLPTLAAYIGAPLPELAIDGRDLSALLESRAGAEAPQEALYFWYEDNQLQALRSGRWKLHFPHSYRDMRGLAPGSDGQPVKYPMSRTGLELYDLERDLGEQQDLAAHYPEVLARLMEMADGMRSRLGDSLLGVHGTENRPAGGR